MKNIKKKVFPQTPYAGTFLPSVLFPAVLFPLILLSALAGCSRYSVSVNDNLVYSPPPVFTAFSLPDHNLQDCVDDTIADEHLTGPEQLTRLFCTNRAIHSLDGLKIFDKIQYLGLESNQVASLKELALLPQLKQVNLAGNPVEDAGPLAQLAELNYVDFTNNPALDCSSTEPLKSKGVEIKIPEHCRSPR